MELRDRGTAVIGGFQTLVEMECLSILLKGDEPIVFCPARGIQKMRIPNAWASSIARGRLLIVSPFCGKPQRATTATAELRNRFVASIAGDLFFLYASPGSRALELAGEMISKGKNVLTFDLKENRDLRDIGAKGIV